MQPGTVFASRYEIDTPLLAPSPALPGRAFRGIDQLLERPVLLVLAASPGAAVLSLRDPSLPEVLDAVTLEPDGSGLLVLQLLPGTVLAELLPSLPVADRPAWASAVSERVAALAARCWEAGLELPPLGPAEILLAPGGAIRVLALPRTPASGPDSSSAGSSSAGSSGAGSAAELAHALLTSTWPGAAELAGGLPLTPHIRVAPGRRQAASPSSLDPRFTRELDEVLASAPSRESVGDPLALAASWSRTLAQTLKQPQTTGAPVLPTRGTQAGAFTGTQTNARSGKQPAQQAGNESHDEAAHSRAAGAAANKTARVSLSSPGADAGGGLQPTVRPPSSKRRTVAARAGSVLVVVFAVSAIAFAAGQLIGQTPDPEPSRPPLPTLSSSPRPSPADQRRAIVVVAARDLDPFGNGEENSDLVPLAFDNKFGTAWLTVLYRSAALGNIKPGVGIRLDLGSLQSVRAVEVWLVGRGTDLQLFSSISPGVTPADFNLVTTVAGGGAQVTLAPASPVMARYLLLWLTRLPDIGGGLFQGGVAEVKVVG